MIRALPWNTCRNGLQPRDRAKIAKRLTSACYTPNKGDVSDDARIVLRLQQDSWIF